MLEKVLHQHFGFESFRQGQKEVIQDILNDRDVLAMLPTGSGKSLCYQMPGYIMHGPVLIVSPLLSLMEDQMQALKSSGEKRVTAINSLLPVSKRRRVLAELSNYRFVYVSPETLQDNDVMYALKRASISLFVVDEVHCISQWGHEFRTDYLKLNEVLQVIGRPPCLALTATATDKVREDIIYRLKLKNPALHIQSVDRSNIGICVEKVPSTHAKMRRVIEAVKQLKPPGIVYFSSREWTERFPHLMKEEGIDRSAYYHAGMETEDRLLIQQQFLEDRLDVICSTNAFGMGVNKANVRYVIHFHYPRQIELFLQEAGRAGRDGKDSVSLTFYEDGDHDIPKALIHYEFPDERQLHRLLLELSYRDKAASEDLKQLYDQLGLSETAGRFLTHRLEAEGVFSEGVISIDHGTVGQLEMKIMEYIKKRKILKLQKLTDMQQWLVSNSCRRDHYLKMFNETLADRPEKCCDHCGLSLDHYDHRNVDLNLGEREYSWKEDLRLLLNQSGDTNET